MQVALSRLMTSKGWESHIEASQEAIRKALETPCGSCLGAGEMQEVDPDDRPIGKPGPCNMCAGTGRQLVPGARLEPRGSHIEVK